MADKGGPTFLKQSPFFPYGCGRQFFLLSFVIQSSFLPVSKDHSMSKYRPPRSEAKISPMSPMSKNHLFDRKPDVAGCWT